MLIWNVLAKHIYFPEHNIRVHKGPSSQRNVSYSLVSDFDLSMQQAIENGNNNWLYITQLEGGGLPSNHHNYDNQ